MNRINHFPPPVDNDPFSFGVGHTQEARCATEMDSPDADPGANEMGDIDGAGGGAPGYGDGSHGDDRDDRKHVPT
jgi:hypothetical protein